MFKFVLPKYGFGMKSSRVSNLDTNQKLPEYSRKSIARDLALADVEAIRKREEEERQDKIEYEWFNNRFNEENPKNLVKVKVNLFNQFRQETPVE